MGGKPSQAVPSGFRYVVNLSGRFEYEIGRDTIVVHCGMHDNERLPDIDVLDAMADIVNTLRRLGATLVHCHAGLNRSGLVCARALMRGGHSAHAAIAKVRAARGEFALCNDHFVEWLINHDRDAHGYARALL